jgi:hypothetical protein
MTLTGGIFSATVTLSAIFPCCFAHEVPVAAISRAPAANKRGKIILRRRNLCRGETGIRDCRLERVKGNAVGVLDITRCLFQIDLSLFDTRNGLESPFDSLDAMRAAHTLNSKFCFHVSSIQSLHKIVKAGIIGTVTSGVFLSISFRLFFTSVSAILAIVLWARRREGVWIFIILGIISLYLETIFSILRELGILEETMLVDSIPVITIVFGMLPSMFFITAFLMMIIKHSRL